MTRLYLSGLFLFSICNIFLNVDTLFILSLFAISLLLIPKTSYLTIGLFTIPLITLVIVRFFCMEHLEAGNFNLAISNNGIAIYLISFILAHLFAFNKIIKLHTNR